jgi:hypothetical protein
MISGKKVSTATLLYGMFILSSAGGYWAPVCSSFVLQQPPPQQKPQKRPTLTRASRGWSGAQSSLATSALYASATDPQQQVEVEDIAAMRAGAIKKELESYGISTVTFLEKTELVTALKKARADGLTPKASTTTTAKTSSSTFTTESPPKKTETASSTSTTSSTASSSTSKGSDSRPRNDRLQEEMERCRGMKNGELKQELQALGISTKSFFEKSEFVKALAEAIVDGVPKKKTAGSSNDGDESYAEYANVEVITDDAGPRQSQKQSQQGQQQQQSSGGMGDMGGMGGMADMLKNMGGMGGGAGAGGMGGMADMLKNMGGMGGGAGGMGGMADMLKNMGGMGGMGDNMGKAQELMKNPKVMEIFAKAQKNPKIMQAMTEVMSNPAAFAKYQNDPEVAEVINELRNFM